MSVKLPNLCWRDDKLVLSTISWFQFHIMICCDAETEWILYIFLSWSYWVSIGQGFKVSFIKSIDTTQTKFNEHMWVISCRNWKADDAKKFAGRLNELKNAGRSDKFEVGWKDWQIGMRTWSTVGDWWKNWRVECRWMKRMVDPYVVDGGGVVSRYRWRWK